MRYFPHTKEDIEQMLEAIGITQMDELFPTIPQDCRRTAPMDLPEPITEWALAEKMEALSQSMAVSPEYKIYAGAGSYDHFIPASVSHLLSRSEFVTSYTPYQPELSQGSLQAFFEYQTMICMLTGLQISNASMYDGASALAEAALMAADVTRRKEILVSMGVHPEYRAVLKTYLRHLDVKVKEIPLTEGTTSLKALEEEAGQDAAAVILQNPNFFGRIEEVEDAAAMARKHFEGDGLETLDGDRLTDIVDRFLGQRKGHEVLANDQLLNALFLANSFNFDSKDQLIDLILQKLR